MTTIGWFKQTPAHPSSLLPRRCTLQSVALYLCGQAGASLRRLIRSIPGVVDSIRKHGATPKGTPSEALSHLASGVDVDGADAPAFYELDLCSDGSALFCHLLCNKYRRTYETFALLECISAGLESKCMLYINSVQANLVAVVTDIKFLLRRMLNNLKFVAQASPPWLHLCKTNPTVRRLFRHRGLNDF